MTESQARYQLNKQGLGLMKARSPVIKAHRGGYMIKDLSNNTLVAGYSPEFSMTWDEVETFVNE